MIGPISSTVSCLNWCLEYGVHFNQQMTEGGRLAPVDGKKPKVAMFCTGGIRCEKSTALLRSKGFEEVYHLEGGILKYLETMPQAQSRWQGECFVFDERVSVGHGLAQGDFTLCRSCRDPLSAEDRQSPLYELGVSCAHCHANTTEAQKQGYRERQRQVELAKAAQRAHIGARQTERKSAVTATFSGLLAFGPLPVLYSFRRCPYAMRARLALAVSGQPCELREIELKNKAPELLAASPKATVPVLVMPGGEVIDQSLDIMLWALRQHDPEHWLTPQHGTLQAMQTLIAGNDGLFKSHLDRYKYPNRYAQEQGNHAARKFSEIHRASGARWLMGLEVMLTQHDWLLGSAASWADMAVLPFVRQFAHTDPAWFDAQAWPQLRSWLTRWEASSLFQSVMQKYPPWSSKQAGVVFPACAA
jgi:UPF0176 protein